MPKWISGLGKFLRESFLFAVTWPSNDTFGHFVINNYLCIKELWEGKSTGHQPDDSYDHFHIHSGKFSLKRVNDGHIPEGQKENRQKRRVSITHSTAVAITIQFQRRQIRSNIFLLHYLCTLSPSY